MNDRISVSTIEAPEFINLQPLDINPLMSKCEIKVLYVGQNRNGSVISKEVATEMSKTLRGCPIVAQYIESKGDFGDHGDQIIIDGEGVKFKKLTKPYGFVAPDAKVWFKFFEDKDEFDNICVREYLMTEGFLWTGQFEECAAAIENENPQSMELDEKSLQGNWTIDCNSGREFFIINDATFSKLCILGEDVEPCFEGARVTAPAISSEYSLNEDFTNTLYSMMNELKFALNISKGGPSMDNLETTVVEEAVETVEAIAEEMPTEDFSMEQDKTEEIEAVETEVQVEEFAKAEEEEKKDEEKEEEPEDDEEKEDEEYECKKKEKTKCALLEEELSALQEKYSLLESEVVELRSFKAEIENKEKDAMIESFYMLSDEDKADVIANKSEYSLEDIEAKLSVICVRKKVSFDLNKEVEKEQPATTFNLNSIESESVPAFVSALRDSRKC